MAKEVTTTYSYAYFITALYYREQSLLGGRVTGLAYVHSLQRGTLSTLLEISQGKDRKVKNNNCKA